MKKAMLVSLSLATLLLGRPEEGRAQGTQYAYRIHFFDKAGSPALTNPAAFLSARALARRTRQNIAVIDEDRPVSPSYTDTTLALTQGVMHLSSRWLNYLVVLTNDTSGFAQLRSKPWITAIEPAGYYAGGLHAAVPQLPASGAQNATPQLPILLRSTANPSDYNHSWTQTHLVKGEALHDAGFTGAGMLIAVLDESYPGLRTHPGFQSLNSSGRIADTFSFVYRSPTTGVFAGGTHGTAVLSLMAGHHPGTYIGAAPGASYALYNTENPLSEQRLETDQVVAGLERADSIGADIVNISGGYNTFDYPQGNDYVFSQLDGQTTYPARAVNAAFAKGILCVVAAGNEGSGSWQKILTPGDATYALTVGSVASNGVPALSSGYGPNAAGQVKPEVMAMGNGAAVFTTTGSVITGNGTSYATPQIAGFAACLWQAFPNKTAAEIRNAILRTASQYTNPGNQMGYGIPDFSMALAQLGVRSQGLSDASVFYETALRRIVVETPHSGAATLSLYDLSGRRWHSRELWLPENRPYYWQLPQGMATGLYLVELSQRGASLRKKILVSE